MSASVTSEQHPGLFCLILLSDCKQPWIRTKSEYLPHLTLLLAFWQPLIRSTPLALLWLAWRLTELEKKCQYCDADSRLAEARVPMSSRMDCLIRKNTLGLKFSVAVNIAGGSPCHSHQAHCTFLLHSWVSLKNPMYLFDVFGTPMNATAPFSNKSTWLCFRRSIFRYH